MLWNPVEWIGTSSKQKKQSSNDNSNSDGSSFGSRILGHQVRPIDINEKMQSSYIDYAMSVAMDRALSEIRDDLKPVYRRALCTMLDNSYRLRRGYAKSAKPVSDTVGNHHPHGDNTIYDIMVRMAQPWPMCYPLVDGQSNFGSHDDDDLTTMRHTRARLAPLAMEIVRDIHEDTVDFQPNYDGCTTEPVILPSCIPQPLMNGSGGIAVGMTTSTPPRNLCEVTDAINWCLDDSDVGEKTALNTVMERIKDPDFPTTTRAVGNKGIREIYTTGRSSTCVYGVTSTKQEGVRQPIIITELPYQVNPDRMIANVADQVEDGRLQGIASTDDESDLKQDMHTIIRLKHDAIPHVMLSSLYKHSQLQTDFGADMLAIVDDVPRTLCIDQMVTLYIIHQIEITVRRTRYHLDEKGEHAYILRGLVKVLDMLDKAIALTRQSTVVDTARTGLMGLLDIDEAQADVILVMQLCRLAALERQKIIGKLIKTEFEIANLKGILANPDRQHAVVKEELGEIMEKYGDGRRTQIAAAEGDVTEENLITRESVVATITSTGYAERTKIDAYEAQRRDGKGMCSVDLKQGSIVRHFFAHFTRGWILFFTNKGCVCRLKACELPGVTRVAHGQRIANLLESQPEKCIVRVLQIQSYQDSPYSVLATSESKAKKPRLEDYELARSAGLIAINLHEDDSLIDARLHSINGDLLLIFKHGQAIRFTAPDDMLRPMDRAATGTQGIRFKDDDKPLSMVVVEGGHNLPIVMTGGFGKETRLNGYTSQNHGGMGMLTLRHDPRHGSLMGTLVVGNNDEIFAVTSVGDIVHTNIDEIRAASRTTKGVRLVNFANSVEPLTIDRNVEDEGEEAASKISEAGTLGVVSKRTDTAKSTGVTEPSDSETEKEQAYDQN